MSLSAPLHAAVVTVESGSNDTNFTFATLGGPSDVDLANGLTPTGVGTAHSASGPLSKLTDGSGQGSGNDTGESFFFNNGVSNGQIFIDLGNVIALGSIETYSWHDAPNGAPAPKRNHSRAGQIYEVYGSVDNIDYFLIASVNTEMAFGVPPYSNREAQVGVGITDIGASYRYLRFDIDELDSSDSTGTIDNTNGTFYGEIDVYAVPEPASLALLGLGGLCLLSGRRRP